jgi:hypothetical protein
MLEPDARSLLLDALRPPIGYKLDAAAGTTYSLDLVSLLTAPVAFAMFDRQHADGTAVADPIAMLQALREYSERITIFHQAGQVTVPPIDQRLIVYLEHAVYPIVPPVPDAIFHPKVWYLRFRDAETGEVSLRFLCLSRNLTPVGYVGPGNKVTATLGQSVQPGDVARLQVAFEGTPGADNLVILCNGAGQYAAGRRAMLAFDR